MGAEEGRQKPWFRSAQDGVCPLYDTSNDNKENLNFCMPKMSLDFVCNYKGLETDFCL